MVAGLHHHADAPEAAGYTIPELARLARSSFPAQRCIAFQTLGRILYRLGAGHYGPDGTDLVDGLWRCVDQGRVLEMLQRAAVAGDVVHKHDDDVGYDSAVEGEGGLNCNERETARDGDGTNAASQTAKYQDGEDDGNTTGSSKSGGGHPHPHPHHPQHRSATALAIEALWNWQRGGGKRWKAQ